MRKQLWAWSVAVLAALARAQSPTDGFSLNAVNFYVQKPYDLQLSDRYQFQDGVHTLWTRSDDKAFQQGNTTDGRTEMRWDNFNDQGVDHMFDADVMVEAGSNQTCIMQVKSNTSGEAVYMQVFSPGEVRWGSQSGSVMIANAYGTWFNLKAAYNPKTRQARVWINNVLKRTATHGQAAQDWYFKNGTYGTSGVSKAHFRNIKLWTTGKPSGIAPRFARASILPALRIDARGRLLPAAALRNIAAFPLPKP